MKFNIFKIKNANSFKVKEKKRKQVVLEEDVIKNPFLLFLKKNRKSIIMSLMMILICLLLVSVGLAFSLFRGSNDYDITYITGSEQIGTNNDPTIDDEKVEEELLGEIAREDGVVLLVDSFMTASGDVITYYSDGTSIMVTSKGKIYRISTNNKGGFGIDKKGKIDKTAVKFLVNSTTSTLSDGTVITYFSDGTAKVELKEETVFVRDSNNIQMANDNSLDRINPSGVALTNNVDKGFNYVVNKFSDGTALVNINNKSFLVNKNTLLKVENGRVNYDNNNTFAIISKKTYNDGNTITHFSNGSATITDSDGNVIYVKNSGDLVLKNKKLYEIMPNDKGDSVRTIRGDSSVKVTYFNSGAAVVIYPNNDRLYVENSDDIVYDTNKKINDNFESSKLIGVKVTEDGKKAYSFENGKTQVINKDNTSYIVNTDTLTLKPIIDNNDKPSVDEPEEDDTEKPELEEEEDESEDGTTEIPIDPGEGIYITEAEHEYEDPLDVQSTTFVIKNDSTVNKKLRIVIEEISDYLKYDVSRLEPKFVKFQSTVGDDYVPATHLSDNLWVDESGITNYVIYDGILKAKSTVTVAISLYVDYSLLDNSHQNKGFLGTIKVYADADI